MELNLRPPALRARIETGAATEGVDVLSDEELASGTDPIPANREVDGRREAAHERRGAPFPAVVARDADVGVPGGLAVPRRRGNARLYSGPLGSLAAERRRNEAIVFSRHVAADRRHDASHDFEV